MFPKKVHDVMDIMLEYIKINQWAGACFASTAINKILLLELGIRSEAVLGVFHADVLDDNENPIHICFDHGWIEIDGMIFDVAITSGQEVNFGSALLDPQGVRGSYATHFFYAKNQPIEECNEKELIPFNEYMLTSPFFDNEINYWEICEILGNKLSLELSAKNLEEKYSDISWSYEKWIRS